MIKLLFLGTGEYPIEIFKTIIESKDVNVVGLVSSPERNQNEGDIVKIAESHKMRICKPKNINEEAEEIFSLTKPDIILVCNYGQFLGKYILEYPKYRCLNVHFSLLPKLRGACPIEMSILREFRETGVTIQIMEEKMDVGDILFQKKVTLQKEDTGKSLAEKLSKITAESIVEVICSWIDGSSKARKQDHANASYCYREDLDKDKAKIDWNEDAEQIDRMIRAFYPRVVAWTLIKDGRAEKRLKIFRASISKKDIDTKTGTVKIENNKLIIQTAKGTIIPELVQLEGKKEMNIEEFIQGYKKILVFKY